MEGPIARVKTRVRNNNNNNNSGRNNQIARTLSSHRNNNHHNNINNNNCNGIILNGKNRNNVVAAISGNHHHHRSNSFKNNQRLFNPFKNYRNSAVVIGSGVINNQTIANNVAATIVMNNLNTNNGNFNNQQQQQQKRFGDDPIWAGDFTREVYTAICPRLGHNTLHIPEDTVQAVFNDFKLYPTNSQVSEMLQCARQCSRRNGASKYITFGEFCVYAREMKNQKDKVAQIQLQHQQYEPNNKCKNNCQVFLGGSCNPTTWRTDTAIPELQKNNITFYNPQVSMWVPELVAQEHDAKQAASVLLFVVDSQTRSTVGMIEVAFLVASGRCVVLVAQPYRPNQTIMGETITQREYQDLVEGQTTLLMLVKSKGVRVHTNLPSALKCVANTVNSSNAANIDAAELLTSKLRKLREVFDSYSGQDGEITVFEFLKAFRDLTQREITIHELLNYSTSNSNENNIANKTITFDKFCVLMAEHTDPDNCDNMTTKTTTTTNGRVISQPFQRQCSTNNNTCNIDNSYINGNHHNNTKETKYDVFLGGSRNSHMDWRREFAIPSLKKHGVTYYNPTVRETTNNSFDILDNFCVMNKDNNDVVVVNDEDILQWKQAMDNSKVLLFVITNDTRSLTTMILAAHYLGSGKDIVLYIEQLPDEGSVICNETLSSQAVKDYNRGRVYLADMAKRKRIPVFDNITEAIDCVIDQCQKR